MSDDLLATDNRCDVCGKRIPDSQGAWCQKCIDTDDGTLTVYDDLEQGTEEWLAARRGMVTASVVGKLLTVGPPSAETVACPTCKAGAGPCMSAARKEPTPIKTFHDGRIAAASGLPSVISTADNETSRGLTATLVAERITGFTDPTYISADMYRGMEDEPRAIEVYNTAYAPTTSVGFMVNDRWGFSIGYSPDALVGDDGLVEVKSRRTGTQVLSVIDGEVPAYNMAQLQCGLLVTGRKWIDYVSYAGGMHLWVKRVEPDPTWHRAIVAAVAQFELNAEAMTDAYLTATTGLAMTERVDNLELVF